jgi:hypothetical protein
MVWDTLPANLIFIQNLASVPDSISNQVVTWNFSGQTLAAGQSLYIDFTAQITDISQGDLIATTAGTDYNDPYYSGPFGRHPPIFSSVNFYPEGQPVIYPNPFSLSKDRLLKIVNMVPGSLITFYTLSGEIVTSIDCAWVTQEWNARNRQGSVVSPGIYYYLITNQNTKQIKRGKLFIVR